MRRHTQHMGGQTFKNVKEEAGVKFDIFSRLSDSARHAMENAMLLLHSNYLNYISLGYRNSFGPYRKASYEQKKCRP